MKGIILAGGSGTRLYPITKGVSKQLMPIYDKPMIFYPLSTLMMAEIKDFIIITTKENQEEFQKLLRDGKELGIHISYVVQPSPDGIAQAFLLTEKLIEKEDCALVLGDNIFFGEKLGKKLKNAKESAENGNATIFGYQVNDPRSFGIMEIDKNNNVLSVEEKPENPKSNFVITGVYFYPKGVVEKAKQLVPSSRGELEITSLNELYLKEGKLKAELLDEKYKWFDTGTFESLFEATHFVREYELNNERLLGSPEEIAFKNGWINESQLLDFSKVYHKNSYGTYLQNSLVENKGKED